MALIKIPIGPGPKREVLRAVALMKKALRLGLSALDRFEKEVRKVQTTKRRGR